MTTRAMWWTVILLDVVYIVVALCLMGAIGCGEPARATPVKYPAGEAVCADTCPGARTSLARLPDETLWCFCQCQSNVADISFPLGELPDTTGLDSGLWHAFAVQECGR